MRNRENNLTAVRLMQILAGTVGLVGAVGLIALLSQGAWAAPPAQGFQPGPRTFTNPFAGGKTQPNTFFDDSDDSGDDFDFPDQGPGAQPPQGQNQAEEQNAPSNPVNVQVHGNQVSVGGTPGGGVIPGKQVPPLPVDTDTAAGSKEIVTDFNFPDADIMDIAKALGKLTGKNFIFDKDVKGRISIISNSPITVGDAWKAFLTALDINGYALIPSGKYVRIARQRDARDKQLHTYVGDYSPDTDALITRVFPLKYLSAEEVARNFRSFMPANSRIIPYEQTNTVIVTDTGSNIQKLEKLLQILDVEGYDAGIQVIPVKYASATDLAKLIDTLIPGTPAARTGAPRFGSHTAAAFSARRTKEGGIINTIIADERTNTLIVNANNKGAEQVRELVAKLDQKLPSSAGGGKVHVVYLQFAEAEQIANTLNSLSTGATAARPATRGGTGTNPVQASLFEGSIRVSPDKATNSLVVTASPTDFSTVQRVINRLDIPRDQVYAEVVIMEITLSHTSSFSANLASPTQAIALTPSTDLLDFALNPLSQKGATLGLGLGAEKTFTVGGQSVTVKNVQGLIHALQVKSNGNILATPQILALDNTEATFETSEKIPVPTTTQVQGAGVAQSFTKEPVSLSIKIKPQINKVANFVKLDIDTKLEDISNRQLPVQVAPFAFATLSRSAKTSIVVADKDTVVLGGLVRDNHNETVSKIPILGDIPVLGWLFKSKTADDTKTNLLVFITPTIVRQYESIRAILDKKLKERDEFIETATGGVDTQRRYRDNLIRNLPDIHEITSRKVQRVVTIDGKDETEGHAPSHLDNGGNMDGVTPAPEQTDVPEAVPPPAPSDESAPLPPETESP